MQAIEARVEAVDMSQLHLAGSSAGKTTVDQLKASLRPQKKSPTTKAGLQFSALGARSAMIQYLAMTGAGAPQLK